MVHRPAALSRPSAIGGPILAVAIAAVQAVWLGWFLLEPLPNAANAGGRGLSRLTLLLRALPHVVPGLRLRDSYLGIALGELGHPENLPQRVPIALASAWIAASAVATGGLGLRGLGLRPRLDRAERLALAFGLGATALGVVTLGVGRLGWLSPGVVRPGLAAPIVAEGLLAVLGRRPDRAGRSWPRSSWPGLGFVAVTGPFVVAMILGAMLPTIEFDATEYHLQGPKEYFQAGRIAFLPHNVYTSMPFGVEMLHLLGMEVVGDWWLGALVGQVLIALFATATAAMVVLATRRVGSARAAWVAGVVYLSAPWVYRLAVLPFVEGPLCFYHAALAWLAIRSRGPDGPAARPLALGLVAGLLAGGAMAIKYPGLISAVIPFGAWAVARSWRARDWRIAAGYAVGVAVVVGPWLAKNAADTGNPVYPLAFGVFGGRHWDAESDAKWSAVHGPRSIDAGAFARSVVEVAGRSDWQTPLVALLAPLAMLRPGSRREAGWLWGFSAYLFLTWWLLTHRLDRFWLPMLPPLAILAGLGSDRLRRGWLASLLTVGVAANAVLIMTGLAGSNEWTGDLAALRSSVPAGINAPLARMDAGLPPGARVLLVGQAGVFHLNRPVVYNTVFNRETFEAVAKGRSADEVRRALAALGVAHVYVDWVEIERYRSPGNYGFTPFVTPEAFARLVAEGVLGPPARMGAKQELYPVRGAAVRPR